MTITAPFARSLTDGARLLLTASTAISPVRSVSRKNCLMKGESQMIKKTWVSMWENPACCLDPCPDPTPRMDMYHYEISDKATRVYNQTWRECPQKGVVPKKICCMANVMPPPFKKRPKNKRPSTAIDCKTKDDDDCKTRKDKKCQKLKLPCCPDVRDPPKCYFLRVPSNCKKVCTPYPSFSECVKPKPKPKRPVECHCLDLVAMCDVIRAYQKRAAMKKLADE